MTKEIVVIGAGAWGTALALLCARAGNSVTIFARDPMVVDEINHRQRNRKFLPQCTFDVAIKASIHLEDVAQKDVYVLAVPAQQNRGAIQSFASIIPATSPMILTSKGIEQSTLFFMSEVLASEVPNQPVAVLSGPNFSTEIAQSLPAAATLAVMPGCEDLINIFATQNFRPYLSYDMMGVQVAGAVKNVLAIASGMVTGAGLGENARAALITRGMAELIRLGLAKGGQMDTFLGLSGYGDVLLTCTSLQSRNMAFGYSLSQEVQRNDTLKEGVFTAQTIVDLSEKYEVEMPICSSVYKVISGASDIPTELAALMARPLQKEFSRTP
jgi:glycerol-3-phosphate dehydrogenase (NAD(P)+)